MLDPDRPLWIDIGNEEVEVKTLKQLAQEALDIQDASVVSGLVHAWSRAITCLRVRLKEHY